MGRVWGSFLERPIAVKVLFVLLKYFWKLKKCDLHNNLEHSVYIYMYLYTQIYLYNNMITFSFVVDRNLFKLRLQTMINLVNFGSW